MDAALAHRALLKHDEVMKASMASRSRLVSITWIGVVLGVGLVLAVKLGHLFVFWLVQQLPFGAMFAIGASLPTVIPALFALMPAQFPEARHSDRNRGAVRNPARGPAPDHRQDHHFPEVAGDRPRRAARSRLGAFGRPADLPDPPRKLRGRSRRAQLYLRSGRQALARSARTQPQGGGARRWIRTRVATPSCARPA